MGKSDKPIKKNTQGEDAKETSATSKYWIGRGLDNIASSRFFERVKTVFAIIGFLAIIIGVPAGSIAIYKFFCLDKGKIEDKRKIEKENREKAAKSENYLSLYEKEEKDFFEKNEVHYMLFLDESGSTKELPYHKKTYRQVKELLYGNLGLEKVLEKEPANIELKRLVFSYMIYRLCKKIKPQYKEKNFILSDYFTKKNYGIIDETTFYQSCENGNKPWLAPLKRENSGEDTNLYTFFENIGNKIADINKNDGDKSKFFVVTILSDFIDDGNKKRGVEEISKLLYKDLGDSKVQINFVVLPSKEDVGEITKAKKLLYKIKNEFDSHTSNLKSKRVSIFGTLDKRVITYHSNWVIEEKTNLLNWIELINTPFIGIKASDTDSTEAANLVSDELWLHPKGKFYNDSSTTLDTRFAIVLDENIFLNKQDDAGIKFSIQTMNGDLNQKNKEVMLNRDVDCRKNIKFCSLYRNECIVIEKSSSSNPSNTSNINLQIYKKGNITKLEIPIKVD